MHWVSCTVIIYLVKQTPSELHQIYQCNSTEIQRREHDMVSIIFIIVAIFSALTGVFLIYSGLKGANSCSAWSKGKVVDIHRTSSSDGDAYAPVVEFLANGQIIRAKAQTQKGVTRNRVPCQMGDSIQIRYNPDRPQSFIIPGYDVNMKVILGIGSLAAAIILILAVCILFVPQ